jgi:hypothetical protein
LCSIGGRGHSIANGTNDIGIVAMTLVLFKTMDANTPWGHSGNLKKGTSPEGKGR